MATTLATFKAAIEAMDIDGVVKTYEGPPSKLNSADLPAKWVDLPDVEETPWTAEGGGGWPQMTLRLFVAYGAIGQNMNDIENLKETITAMDNTLTALRSLDATKSNLTWNLRRIPLEIGNTTYWGLESEITGNG